MCFDRKFEFGLLDGKAAENRMIFPTYIGFSYYQCISATFRKRIEQLLHQSLEPTLSVQSRGAVLRRNCVGKGRYR